MNEIKEKLTELRRWQNYCITILITLIAFISTQFEKIENYLIVSSVSCAILMIICIAFFQISIQRLIKKLKD